MIAGSGFPPGDWSAIIVGHQWPSDEAVAQLSYWKSSREYVATGHDQIADSLQSAKTGPLAMQEGRTADALVQAFDDGEQRAREVAAKNRGKASDHNAVLNSVGSLRDQLHDIAERGNSEIKAIQDSNEPTAVKVSRILAVVTAKQQEANFAAAKCGAEIGDAGQRILDREGKNQSFRQISKDGGVDMSQLFRSRDPKELEPLVGGMLNGATSAQNATGAPSDAAAWLGSGSGASSQQTAITGNTTTTLGSDAGKLSVPAAASNSTTGGLGFNPTSPTTPTDGGSAGKSQIATASFATSGLKAPTAPPPTAPPGPSSSPNGMPSVPTQGQVVNPLPLTERSSLGGASIPNQSQVISPTSPVADAPTPPSAPPPAAPVTVPTSPAAPTLPSTGGSPGLGGAPAMPSAPAQLGMQSAPVSWAQNVGAGPNIPSAPSGFDSSTLASTPFTPSSAPPPFSASPQTIPSAGTGYWNEPFAASQPAPPAYLAPPAPLEPPPPAPPVATNAGYTTPAGPLPAYGADLRPPIPTGAAPTPPPPAPSPPPPAVPAAVTHTSAGTSGPASAAPIRPAPTPVADPASSAAGPAGPAAAGAAGGAAAGALSAEATARARLQRIVDAVARQEPHLGWAAGECSDGTTVLVTDLASGWIPPDVDIPAAVTLLEPALRRGDIASLLGEVKIAAAYTPEHYVPEEAEPIPSSSRPRYAPEIEELGWELNQATHWRDGLPRLAHTVAKAASAGTGVLDTEVDLLRAELDQARDQVLQTYPGEVDSGALGNWQLLAAIAALVDGDKTAANYHFAWFQALSHGAAQPSGQ